MTISAQPNLDIPLPPADLPYDDGEPLETNRHRTAMNVLIRSLENYWCDRDDFFVGGNMFVYYSTAQIRRQDFGGSDFFVALDVNPNPSRKSWVAWEEGGRLPDTIVEFLSASTAEVDVGSKKELYERVFKTKDYFVVDPYEPQSLRGWCLNARQRYEELPPHDRGWLWCETLGLWLGTWEGAIGRETGVWLRFYDPENQLVLLPEEAAQQRAEQAQQQAEQAQQQAQELQELLDLYRERFGELPK